MPKDGLGSLLRLGFGQESRSSGARGSLPATRHSERQLRALCSPTAAALRRLQILESRRELALRLWLERISANEAPPPTPERRPCPPDGTLGRDAPAITLVTAQMIAIDGLSETPFQRPATALVTGHRRDRPSEGPTGLSGIRIGFTPCSTRNPRIDDIRRATSSSPPTSAE